MRDKLDPSLVLTAIAALPDDLSLVAFTGGEPFLHGAHLVKYVQAAHERNFRTRIVTSAYFGSTGAAAASKLRPLAKAGLDELSVSWDDFHEEFVKFDAVANVVNAAIELGISTAINCVETADSRWTRVSILEALGENAGRLAVVAESHLNLTGRAEVELADRPAKANGYLGPCPYVLTGPTLSAKGKLLACCGVIPDTDRLSIGTEFEPADIPDLIHKSFSNPLLVWLFLRGPYSLVKEIALRRGIELPSADGIGGNCEACKILLTNPTFLSGIDDVLKDKLSALANEMLLLESIGFLNPEKIAAFWSTKSATRVGL
ncbi:hypothetical protein NKJ76_26220 [Mesorhizobium sp. M0029]